MPTTLFEIIQNLGGFRKQSAKTWEGPCPQCGGNDRFIVWIHEDRFSCRGCDFKGDIITWFRQIEGKNCGEAHLAAGKHCDSHGCAAYGKCSATREGVCTPRTDKQRKLQTPKEKDKKDDWHPTDATTPAEVWQDRAVALVNEAHEALLANPEQMAYLKKRGLPLGAVKKYRLGWIEKDIFKSRASWGLSPKKTRPNGIETSTLWIPRGIVIPMFGSDFYRSPFTAHHSPSVHRIRIRRDRIKEGEIRYYWLEGSGDDTWMLNPEAKVQIVIETDLDGLLIDWHAGDLVGAVPLGSCSPRPKRNAADIFDRAVCILNALDFEPRVNEKTGRNEAPGGENWLRWWKPHYPQAKRHPAPGGKDAGEAYQAGTDIRAWIIAGLPLGLRPSQPVKHENSVCEIVQVTDSSSDVKLPDFPDTTMRIIDGREIWFPRTPEVWNQLTREGKITIGPKEGKLLAGGCPALLVEMLLITKEVFSGAFLSEVKYF